ncbi:MAG: MerR family transcriptional regulator [Prevotella sp.]|jgi:DNA-binding transcriptional MerR regulator|nr:MerR family transcriptional regulator [Prevotella sp.]
MLDLSDDNKLYYSIKEVAEHIGVEASTLRFWEKEFDEINPRRSPSGIRQYVKKDIETIQVIYSLINERGMTLDGARKKLRNKKDDETRRIELLNKLESIKKELEFLRDSFEQSY